MSKPATFDLAAFIASINLALNEGPVDLAVACKGMKKERRAEVLAALADIAVIDGNIASAKPAPVTSTDEKPASDNTSEGYAPAPAAAAPAAAAPVAPAADTSADDKRKAYRAEYIKARRDMGPVAYRAVVVRRTASRLASTFKRVGDGWTFNVDTNKVVDGKVVTTSVNVIAEAKKKTEEAQALLIAAADLLAKVPQDWRPSKNRKADETVEVVVGSVVGVREKFLKEFEGMGVELTDLEVVGVNGNNIAVKSTDGSRLFFKRAQLVVMAADASDDDGDDDMAELRSPRVPFKPASAVLSQAS